MDINKIIDIIHTLKEEGMVTGAIANSTNPPGQINIAGLPPDNPPVKKKNKYIYGAGFRKNWLQRRTPQP
jgi:hypothetical protein